MAAGDIATKYGTATAMTITLASLATSSTLLVGRESTVVATGDPILDYLITAAITTGTSPTAGNIQVWAYGQHNDTPTYPSVITGSDAGVTIPTSGIKEGSFALLANLETGSTSDQKYNMRPVSLASKFGFVPKRWGIIVVHDTAVNLNATAGNHSVYYQPIYAAVAAA